MSRASPATGTNIWDLIRGAVRVPPYNVHLSLLVSCELLPHVDPTCMPFFLYREEEGLEGLKELQWELPLQDGRSLL